MNDRLRRALGAARLDDVAVSAKLGVDPKTAQRWIGGRRPQRRNRWALAELLNCHEYDLWPELGGVSGAASSPEVHAVYPHRGAVPREVWHRLFASAEQRIGILVYSGLFLAEDVDVRDLLLDRARAGVNVRVLLGDPESPRVAERGAEEGIDDAMAAKVRNTIVLYRPLLECENVQVRLHQTVLYNSIYLADHEVLVNPHIYGAAAAYAPIFHLRSTGGTGMVATYAESFERVWNGAAAPT